MFTFIGKPLASPEDAIKKNRVWLVHAKKFFNKKATVAVILSG